MSHISRPAERMAQDGKATRDARFRHDHDRGSGEAGRRGEAAASGSDPDSRATKRRCDGGCASPGLGDGSSPAVRPAASIAVALHRRSRPRAAPPQRAVPLRRHRQRGKGRHLAVRGARGRALRSPRRLEEWRVQIDEAAKDHRVQGREVLAALLGAGLQVEGRFRAPVGGTALLAAGVLGPAPHDGAAKRPAAQTGADQRLPELRLQLQRFQAPRRALPQRPGRHRRSRRLRSWACFDEHAGRTQPHRGGCAGQVAEFPAARHRR